MEELYQYDPRNRLTAFTKGGVTTMFQYDHAGNLLVDDKARYSYDAFNRTEKAETFDGHIQLNRYDAEGLRYEMEENGNLVRFIFNQDREAVSEEDTSGLNRLIRGTELIASNSSADSARTYYHYASDEMGSTTHIVDEAGAVQNRYEYDVWGNIMAQEEAIPNRFKFTGQQFDPVTQQYYLRARFYNPVVARFTQEDTYRGDGLNLYAYCINNPITYTDPSGFSRSRCYKEALKYFMDEGYSRSEAKKLAEQHVETQRQLSNIINTIVSSDGKNINNAEGWKEFDSIIDRTALTESQKEAMKSGARTYLSQAVSDYNKAYDLQTSTGADIDKKRTFAYGDEVYTVNGYPNNRTSAGIRDNPAVLTMKPNIMTRFVASIDSNLLWKSGRFYQTPIDGYAGHAEKQSLYYRFVNGKDMSTTGITRPMCNNCVAFFDRTAARSGQSLYTADPNNITIFMPGTSGKNSLHFKIGWTPNGSVV